jgi:DNA mismatch repair protein MutS
MGIASLKVGYNKVFGYFIEISNAHRTSVPADYVAKQSLVNAQRFFTPELKDKEDLILHTEERRVREENRVYEGLCAAITARAGALQLAAGAIGRIDAVQSLAMVARSHGYRRPVVDESMTLEIVGGRHAVLERVVTEPFVANDVLLDPERRQFGLITGPNMSGKSTFLRQTALIVLLAQMGSFVPAQRARIGIVDRIFTRVGASDRLSRGESTFLVEMNETANILHHMTDRSLVILDEVGRGTSTYDGLAIAWAVTEYLLQGVVARPRTLFATHFHELTQLKSTYPRLVNLKIAIREWEGGIVFLRKIVPGTSDRSFGIHAAKVAGLPALVIRRAEEILQSLELRRDLVAKGLEPGQSRDQMNLFASGAPTGTDDELRAALREFDLNTTTPLQALQLLQDLKSRIK